MAGTLTEQEFVYAAKQFLELARRIGDGWKLEEPSAGTVFLRKQLKQSISFSNRNSAGDHDREKFEELVVEDPSSVDLGEADPECYQFEYHVMYSVSYQVPILYFNASKSDGTLLRLEDAWNCFRDLAGESQEQLHQTLTQMEHPVLFRPFLALHPCKTAQVLGNVSESRNQIVSFVSSYGPFVGLHLDLRYATLEQ